MSTFVAKMYLFSKQHHESCVKLFSLLFSIFFKRKGYSWWKCKWYRPCFQNLASKLMRIGNKLVKGQWYHNLSTWIHCQFCLTMPCFSCQFPLPIYLVIFHVNIITDSRIIMIFICKGLSRNPEIRNIRVKVFTVFELLREHQEHGGENWGERGINPWTSFGLRVN